MKLRAPAAGVERLAIGALERRARWISLDRRTHVAWAVRVLHPRLEVAVERDAHRTSWTVGPVSVATLHAKFTGAAIGHACFLDTSDETPEETMERLLAAW